MPGETNLKKRAAFALGMSDDWAFAAAAVLFGLADHPPAVEHDVIIFYSDLTEENRELLARIYPCRFIPFDISRIKKETRRGSRMRFARFELFSLLNEYEVISWLDSDILIIKDITGLIADYPDGIAMYQYPPNIPIRNSFVKPIGGYNLDVPAFASGTLVITDSLRNPRQLQEWCYQKTNEWNECINGDQAILNMMLQEFNLDAYPLEEKYCRHPKDGDRGAAILHPWYRRKFWNKTVNPQWDDYYQRWRTMGGDGPQLPHPIKRTLVRMGWIAQRWLKA